jgi:hypothetical protein
MMRTTLDVDADVLEAVKAIAKSRKSTAGKVISELGPVNTIDHLRVT